MPKVDLIEKSRIMFEEVYKFDSTELMYDLEAYSYEQVEKVYNSLKTLYEHVTGESADV